MKLESVLQIKINYADWKKIEAGKIIIFKIENIDFQLLKDEGL